MLNKILSFLFKKSPLTGRGIAALIFSLFCFFYLGLAQSDLVASIIASCLFISLLCSALILVLTSRKIFKSYQALPSYSSETHNIEKFFSLTDTKLPIIIPNTKIAPLTSLSIKREFDDKKIKSKKIILSGFDSNNTTYSAKSYTSISDLVVFPHRGIFTQEALALEYSDLFGLCKIKSIIPLKQEYQVFPKEIHVQSLPIMAASAQLGDMDQTNSERTGDLFDIREYQAGDSLKRVLWKVYAKSGNLVVRQPEPAIIPEGEVAIFCFAKTQNDITAAAMLSYLKMLENQNIIYTVSCLGSIKETAKNLNQAEAIILKSANRSDADKGESFTYFIESTKKYNNSIKKIICFFPKNFKTHWLSEDDSLLFQTIQKEINNSGISLIIASVNEEREIYPEILENKTDSLISKIDQKIKNTKEKNLSNLKELGFGLIKQKKDSSSKATTEHFSDQENIEVGITNA